MPGFVQIGSATMIWDESHSATHIVCLATETQLNSKIVQLQLFFEKLLFSLNHFAACCTFYLSCDPTSNSPDWCEKEDLI